MDVKQPNTCSSLTDPKIRDSKKVGGKEKKKQSELEKRITAKLARSLSKK